MIIPYKEIRDVLGEPLRDSHIVVALRLYCIEKSVVMKDVDFRKFSEWAKAGLSKTRAGCSGKVGYGSRKAAKQKLKKREKWNEKAGPEPLQEKQISFRLGLIFLKQILRKCK